MKIKISKHHLQSLKLCLENDWKIHMLFNKDGWIEKEGQPSEQIPRFSKKDADWYDEVGVIENVHGNYYRVLDIPELQKKSFTAKRQKDIRYSGAYMDIASKLQRAGYDCSELETTDEIIGILPGSVKGAKLFIDTIPRASGAYNYKSGYVGMRKSIHTMGSKIRAVERLIDWLIYNRIPLDLKKTGQQACEKEKSG